MEKKEMFSEWLKQKRAEDKAKKARYEVEEKIAALYESSVEGNSKTFKDEEGFNVTVKKNVAYKLDQELWISVRKEIPDNLRPEKIKFELDKKGFEYLKDHAEDLYKIVSNCVTITPNKTTIDVEKI